MKPNTVDIYELIRSDHLGKEPMSYSLGLFLEENDAKNKLKYYADLFGIPRTEDSEYIYSDKVTVLYVTTRKLELHDDN